MTAWKPIVGKNFQPDAFDAYCRTLKWNTWRPSFIVLHNTGAPDLAQRPNGFTLTHIRNLERYYRDQQKWSAGPHLFVDDKQIWVFTPLTTPGVHTPSWNSIALGIEMLGDYNKDSFTTGRGLLVRQNVIAAITTLNTVLGFDTATTRFHKEDPLTTHKGCPGKNVVKSKLLQDVQGLIVKRHAGEHTIVA